LRGIGVPFAGPAGQGRGGRVEADVGEHLAGGRFTHRPGEAGVRSPAGGAAGDVARIGLAQLGQRRPVVDLIVGAQRPQVPRPGVDLDWFHGSAGVERELVTTSSRSTPNDYLISASTVPWVMAAPASTARPVILPSLWAVTGFSIFIASRTTIRSPADTSCPSSTATLTTVPCIGAVTASPDTAAPPWAPRLRGFGFLRTAPGAPPVPLPSARLPGSETSRRRPPTSTTTFCRGSGSSASTSPPPVNGSTVLFHSVSIQRVCTENPFSSPMNAGSSTTARWNGRT